MTILVDIDGVIFNTQEVLLNWLNEVYKTDYVLDDITSYDWFDKTFDHPWEIMKFDEFWNKVKANKQAIYYFLKWKHEGHTIKFVTASYYHRSLPFKIHKLLDCFNGEFDDKDVIVCHDKSLIMGNLLIDDYLKNCNEFHGFSIVYTQPWNKDTNLIRTDDWAVIDKRVQYIKK